MAYLLSSGACNVSNINFSGAHGQGMCVFDLTTGIFYGDCDSILDFLPNGYATSLDNSALLELQRNFENAFRATPIGFIFVAEEFWARLIAQILFNNEASVEETETNAVALTEALVQEALEKDDNSRNWVVRGGLSEANNLVATYREHLLVPGLFGVSSQHNPGSTIRELACISPFRNATITVSTREILIAAGALIGEAIDVVPSPRGVYHHTITVIGHETLPKNIAEVISASFVTLPNPCRRL